MNGLVAVVEWLSVNNKIAIKHQNFSTPRVKANLAGNSDGLEEVGLSGRINDVLARVVPVEVHHGLLEPQEVVDGADDQVDGSGVAGLGSKVILPV